MGSSRSCLLVSMLVLFQFGCQDGNVEPPSAAPIVDAAPPHYREIALAVQDPDAVAFDDAIHFHISSVKLHLLGLRSSDDPEKREKALKLTKDWFHGHEPVKIYVRNLDSAPFDDEDGLAVWLASRYGGTEDLNLLLARSGLVELDLDRHEGYAFEILTKSDGIVPADWRGWLVEASHRKAE